MPNSSKRWITVGSAMLLCIEGLAVSVLVLVIIAFVAGRYHDSLGGLAMLTFDTSSVKGDLADHGIVSPSPVPDWYEPHYLSVCRGTWRAPGTHVKNDTATVCTTTSLGYTFALPELLAADAGLPRDSVLVAGWAFAVLDTRAPSVCVVVVMTFVNWAILDYGVAIVQTWGSTAATPRFWLWQGVLPSGPALVASIVLAAEVTARTQKILNAEPVVERGVAWSTPAFYVVTWLATGLMCLVVALAVGLLYTLRRQSSKTANSASLVAKVGSRKS